MGRSEDIYSRSDHSHQCSENPLPWFSDSAVGPCLLISFYVLAQLGMDCKMHFRHFTRILPHFMQKTKAKVDVSTASSGQ